MQHLSLHHRPTRLQCLSGALYKGDFARIMRSVGFSQWWTVTSRVIDVDDSTVAAGASPTRALATVAHPTASA